MTRKTHDRTPDQMTSAEINREMDVIAYAHDQMIPARGAVAGRWAALTVEIAARDSRFHAEVASAAAAERRRAGPQLPGERRHYRPLPDGGWVDQHGAEYDSLIVPAGQEWPTPRR